jgi:hypothetical protein
LPVSGAAPAALDRTKIDRFAGRKVALSDQPSRLPCRRSRVRVPSAALRSPWKSAPFCGA